MKQNDKLHAKDTAVSFLHPWMVQRVGESFAKSEICYQTTTIHGSSSHVMTVMLVAINVELIGVNWLKMSRLVEDTVALGVGVKRFGPICDHHFNEYTGAVRVNA